MALGYQTAYHLGRRGTVTRTYGGPRALIAIGVDLALAFVFGVVGLAFGLVGRTLRVSWRLARLVSIGFRELVVALSRFLAGLIALPRRFAGLRAGKPVMASFDEL